MTDRMRSNLISVVGHFAKIFPKPITFFGNFAVVYQIAGVYKKRCRNIVFFQDRVSIVVVSFESIIKSEGDGRFSILVPALDRHAVLRGSFLVAEIPKTMKCQIIGIVLTICISCFIGPCRAHDSNNILPIKEPVNILKSLRCNVIRME